MDTSSLDFFSFARAPHFNAVNAALTHEIVPVDRTQAEVDQLLNSRFPEIASLIPQLLLPHLRNCTGSVNYIWYRMHRDTMQQVANSGITRDQIIAWVTRGSKKPGTYKNNQTFVTSAELAWGFLQTCEQVPREDTTLYTYLTTLNVSYRELLQACSLNPPPAYLRLNLEELKRLTSKWRQTRNPTPTTR